MSGFRECEDTSKVQSKIESLALNGRMSWVYTAMMYTVNKNWENLDRAPGSINT